MLARWVGLSHTELWPDGTATMHLSVSKPGPEAVRVDVPAYDDGHAAWEAASPQDVAPGEMAGITIHGTDVDCDDGETGSCQRGRLLVDGEPTRVQSWATPTAADHGDLSRWLCSGGMDPPGSLGVMGVSLDTGGRR